MATVAQYRAYLTRLTAANIPIMVAYREHMSRWPAQGRDAGGVKFRNSCERISDDPRREVARVERAGFPPIAR